MKRPRPKGSEDIGSWQAILQYLAIVSIFTNAALLVYTQNNFYFLDDYNKFIIFMCLVFFFLLVKIIISELISDTPSVILEIQKRHKYIFQKLTKGKNKILTSKLTCKPTNLEIKFS
jgi:hypothetical protein